MSFLLAICMTCAGDLQTDKLPDTCDIIPVFVSSGSLESAFETAFSFGYLSVYLLDEEDGAWLRRSGAPTQCDLED